MRLSLPVVAALLVGLALGGGAGWIVRGASGGCSAADPVPAGGVRSATVAEGDQAADGPLVQVLEVRSGEKAYAALIVLRVTDCSSSDQLYVGGYHAGEAEGRSEHLVSVPAPGMWRVRAHVENERKEVIAERHIEVRIAPSASARDRLRALAKKVLEDTNSATADDVLNFLGGGGPDALRALRAVAVSRASRPARKQAVMALSYFKQADVIPTLIEALANSDMRLHVLQAFLNLGVRDEPPWEQDDEFRAAVDIQKDLRVWFEEKRPELEAGFHAALQRVPE